MTMTMTSLMTMTKRMTMMTAREVLTSCQPFAMAVHTSWLLSWA
jgi:hypothetical protein